MFFVIFIICFNKTEIAMWSFPEIIEFLALVRPKVAGAVLAAGETRKLSGHGLTSELGASLGLVGALRGRLAGRVTPERASHSPPPYTTTVSRNRMDMRCADSGYRGPIGQVNSERIR